MATLCHFFYSGEGERYNFLAFTRMNVCEKLYSMVRAVSSQGVLVIDY